MQDTALFEIFLLQFRGQEIVGALSGICAPRAISSFQMILHQLIKFPVDGTFDGDGVGISFIGAL